MTTCPRLPNGQRVALSKHAVHRYLERARPTLTYGSAGADLARLLEHHAEVQREQPEWLAFAEDVSESVIYGYAVVGDVVIVLVETDVPPGVAAVTVLCRGHLPDDMRANRNRHAHSRRAAKRARRKGLASPPRPAPDAA